MTTRMALAFALALAVPSITLGGQPVLPPPPWLTPLYWLAPLPAGAGVTSNSAFDTTAVFDTQTQNLPNQQFIGYLMVYNGVPNGQGTNKNFVDTTLGGTTVTNTNWYNCDATGNPVNGPSRYRALRVQGTV